MKVMSHAHTEANSPPIKNQPVQLKRDSDKNSEVFLLKMHFISSGYGPAVVAIISSLSVL